VKVNYANIYLRRGFDADSSYIRIIFYKNVDDSLEEKIIFQNIIQKKRIEPGWYHLDLTKHDIYYDGDFYISLEFIPDIKKNTEIYAGAILTKGKGYSRINSQGVWGKLSGAYSINVEIEY